jgi:hypothetical protein
MSGDLKKIFKNLDDLERKVTKSNKIVQKGEKMSLGDAIKLGRKSNSVTSTINKGIKEYNVSSLDDGKTRNKADNTKGVTPSDADAKKILDQMTKIVDLTEQQLNSMVSNKAQFEKLRVGGKF